MPHGQCYLWQPGVLWSNVLGDGLIAVAYFLIPLSLFLLYRRREVRFRFIVLLFVLFIGFCGLTHLIGAITTWIPMYQISGAVKDVTALISLGTAYTLWRIMPQALTLPTPMQLERANALLSSEVQRRMDAEEALRNANFDLERRIRERTSELEASNAALRREIQMRKDIEIKLREVISAAPTAILMADQDRRIVLCNPPAEQLCGYSREALYTMHADDLVVQHHEAVRDESVALFSEHPQMRHFDDSRGIRVRHSSGKEIPVEMALNQVKLEGQTFVLASIVDISRRHEQQLLLHKYMEDLTRSNKALDEFVYVVSHDLKDPLRGMNNYITFLMEDYGPKLDAGARRYLEATQNLAHRLYTLIDRLLTYSRLGHAELEIQQIDMDRLVAEVLQSLHPLLESEAAEVEVAAEPMGAAQCDRTWVGQLLQNLVVNAVKYNDKTEKQVFIGHYRDDGRHVFFVRDNGIGIPFRHRDRIFQIFKRLHAVDVYGGGAGAGLTIAQKVVERHGGRIWLESTPGEGSTFYFTLQ